MTRFDPEEVLSKPLAAIRSTVSAEEHRNVYIRNRCGDGAFWAPVDESASPARRLDADPHGSVEIDAAAAGLLRQPGLGGRAEVAPPDPDRLRRHLGPDPERWNAGFVREVARIDDPSGRMIRPSPDGVFTDDVSVSRTGPAPATP